MRVAGFGFRKGANVESLMAALQRAGGAKGVTHIATIEVKVCAAIRELGQQLGVPLETVSEDGLASVQVSTHSDKSAEAYGTGSLSEAVALIAAGEGARLIALRAKSDDGMATCAIAEGRGT